MFAACSDGGSPSKVSVDELGDVDSSSASGDEAKSGNSGATVQSNSSSKPGDKIVINGGKDTIFVADAEGSLYYSSGVFCWTEGCEKNFAPSSSSATKPASSGTNVSGGSGDGFLYNMVRIIAGTLMAVGMGKMEPDAVAGIIAGCDRTKAGQTAEPQGLTLMEIFYE